MKYTILTNAQLACLCIGLGVISASLVIFANMYFSYKALPQVIYSNDECIRVLNFENGHAFNCADVDIVLRVYRKEVEQ